MNREISPVRDEVLLQTSQDQSQATESSVLNTTLIYLLEVNLSQTGLLVEPNPYLAIVFDTGTLFISKTDETIFQLWKSKAVYCLAKNFDIIFWRNRGSDFVNINLGFSKLNVEKVGSATRCIANAIIGKCFYLPSPGIARVDAFFLKTLRRTWIDSGKVLTGLQSSINNKYQIFSDLDCVIGRIIPSSISTLTLSEPEGSSTSPGVNYPSSIGSPSLYPATISPSLTSIPDIKYPATISPSLTSIPDIKYPALSVSQAIHCTRCKHCRQTFKFTIEYLYHFAIQTDCFRMITKGATQDLYSRITEDIVSNVNINPQLLVCMKGVGENRSCGSKFQTVLQYCLHIDAHRPNSNEVFSCYKCSNIYFTPFSYYRHSCLMTLRPGSGVLTKNVVGGPSYSRLIKPVRDNILTCPQCRNKFLSISGLINHLNLSNSSCLAEMTHGVNVISDRPVNLSSLLLSKTNIALQKVQCEVCEEVLDNQVSYCLHLDHHSRDGVSIQCKTCLTSYSTVCKYVRHSCTSLTSTWCVFCELTNRLKPPAIETPTGEEIIKIEDIKMEVEDSSPRIVSVSGSVNFLEDLPEKSKKRPRKKPVKRIEHREKNQSRNLKNKSGFNKWESFYCFDCQPTKILNNSIDLRRHVRTRNHGNIKAAWKYDQLDVKVFNLKKSYKYGVLVREHMADYYAMKKNNSLKLLYKIVEKSC